MWFCDEQTQNVMHDRDNAFDDRLARNSFTRLKKSVKN